MCRVCDILYWIFGLFITFAQAKHAWIRVYPFASGDCNGPPIMGNVDIRKDVCMMLPFGGSSIKLTEVKLGDWTRAIGSGATGCYFYTFTQFGCYERYLDIILDPGDVMNLCIPSRDANDPIFSVSYTCIYGEPPRRRWALPAAANMTANTLNMTSPDVASAYLRGRAVVDELRKANGTTRFNNSIASGAAQNGYNFTSITIDSGNRRTDGTAQNISVRSINNHGSALINGGRNFNLTRKTNDSSPVSAAGPVKSHGPALINGKPNFNSSHELTTRESDDEPSIVSGILDSNSTHKFNNSKSESPVESVGARSVNRHGPVLINEELNLNSSREYKDSESDDHVQLGNNATGPHELVDTNKVPITSGEHGQVHSMGTPTAADLNKHSSGSEGSEDDSDDDSDYDSDWSDDDSDEYESYRNSTSLGNSTSPRKRDSIHFYWDGPRKGVWMLHPWTGSILCYACIAKAADTLSFFQCRWGYKKYYHIDCGEKPLAPVYTKTVTVQPVVTVTPLPGQQSIQKRSWHMPVYLQNPWYPGITVCSIAEWEGKSKRARQSIKIEQMHKKLYRCDRSAIAQDIMIWVRTATYTLPAKTLNLIAQQPAQTVVNTVIPPPIHMFSTVEPDNEFVYTTKVTATSFEPIVLSTSSAAPSEPATSASISILRALDFGPMPTTTFGNFNPPIEPTTVTRPTMASYAKPVSYYTSTMVGVRPNDITTTTSTSSDRYTSTVVGVLHDDRTRTTKLSPDYSTGAIIGFPPNPIETKPNFKKYHTSAFVGARPTDTAKNTLQPESTPTPQSQPQHMYVDSRAGGFSTVIVSRSHKTL